MVVNINDYRKTTSQKEKLYTLPEVLYKIKELPSVEEALKAIKEVNLANGYEVITDYNKTLIKNHFRQNNKTATQSFESNGKDVYRQLQKGYMEMLGR